MYKYPHTIMLWNSYIILYAVLGTASRALDMEVSTQLLSYGSRPKNKLYLSGYGGKYWLTTWQGLELLKKQISGYICEGFYRLD